MFRHQYGNAASEQRSMSIDDFFSLEKTKFATASGEKVSEDSALKNSVVYAAVGLITDSIAFLPPYAVKEADDGTISPAKLPNWVRSPYPNNQQAVELRRSDVFSQMMMSLLLWGNAYCFVLRGPLGQILGLVPLAPYRVYCNWVDPVARTDRYYQIDGGPWLTSYDVMHIQGPTIPGRPTGLSVIGQAAEAIGLGLTLEEFGARYFSQGSMAKVVLKVPNKNLSPQEAKQLVANYEQFHRGPNNWHRPAVAGAGADIQTISIPPNDAQFLESRDWQAVDIARWFRVPPHAVNIISKETSWGSGLSEQNTAMLQRTFRPWIMRFEAAFTAYTSYGEDRGVLIKLDDSALQRGSYADQVTTANQMFAGGIATRNEARKIVGLGRVDDGDYFLTPANTAVSVATENGQDTAPGENQDDTSPDSGKPAPAAEAAADSANSGTSNSTNSSQSTSGGEDV